MLVSGSASFSWTREASNQENMSSSNLPPDLEKGVESDTETKKDFSLAVPPRVYGERTKSHARPDFDGAYGDQIESDAVPDAEEAYGEQTGSYVMPELEKEAPSFNMASLPKDEEENFARELYKELDLKELESESDSHYAFQRMVRILLEEVDIKNRYAMPDLESVYLVRVQQAKLSLHTVWFRILMDVTKTRDDMGDFHASEIDKCVSNYSR